MSGKEKPERLPHEASAATGPSLPALFDDAPPRRDLLIEYLHRVQDSYGCISTAHVQALARWLKVPAVEVEEVATFYHHFDRVTDGEAEPRTTVRVCTSICCEQAGSLSLLDELRASPPPGTRVQAVPCVGRCAGAPVAVIDQHPVEHADLDQIQTLSQKPPAVTVPEPPALSAYLAAGGYRLPARIASGELSSMRIIANLETSGLRGLGGAGFPTARKWRLLREQPHPRLMAVNIDEGEPGTFKDRVLLERDPHRFLEGMLIAASVIEARAVYIYLRDEYAGIRRLLQRELGELLRNPPCKLPTIELRRGAGSYVCGEESAMLESIEGRRGMPRLRPPYVAERGLFDRPTLVQNMETLFWVREILETRGSGFADAGLHGRSGLRHFSVSGHVRKPGVHLAPAGITLRELVDNYCDGMQTGHELLAYFPGGASGGILPAKHADIPLDFDTLQEHGCFIGSAAIIVVSQQDDLRALATNAMRFFASESCGQCTPCRVGTVQLAGMMAAPDWDAGLMREISQTMADASICGLGQAAPNPLLSLLRYFPELCPTGGGSTG